MTLQQIECFLELAETLNYTVTAQKMFISQPAVSKHIQTLEADLGFKLIDRSIRRRIVLTPAGLALRECLMQCQETWDKTIQEIRESLASSPISFYLPDDMLLPTELCKKLNNFRIKYPQNTPVFNTTPANQIQDVLKSGAFLFVPEYYEIQGNFDSQIVRTGKKEHLKLICSANHPMAGQPAKNFADCPLFLLSTLPKKTIQHLTEKYEKSVKKPGKIMFTNNPINIFLYLVSADIGVTIGNSWYAWLEDPRLYSVDLPYEIQYKIYWDSEKEQTPQGLAMAKSLGQAFRCAMGNK